MVFANLQHNYEILLERIEKSCQKSSRNPDGIRIIAVTKTHPVETVQALIDLGIKDIGENRVQEIECKAPLLTGDYTLHLIGHLQTNKVAKVVPLVQWIQSIDSRRLADKIRSSITETGRKMKVLVEVNTSGEASKSGCLPSDCKELCDYAAKSPSLEFHGLMTVGPLVGGERETRAAFAHLRKLSEECGHLAKDGKPVLSMGMSGDFEWAIEEGSTMVRVGSLLLGNRM
jgi:PLP dependent protein